MSEHYYTTSQHLKHLLDTWTITFTASDVREALLAKARALQTIGPPEDAKFIAFVLNDDGSAKVLFERRSKI